MKLRILDNSIRLRLSQTEVNSLGSGNAVHVHVSLQPDSFKYTVLPGVGPLRAAFRNSEMIVEIPQSDIDSWWDSDRVSIEGNHEDVKILVEKDFKCLTDRNEDESDLFENPNSDC